MRAKPIATIGGTNAQKVAVVSTPLHATTIAMIRTAAITTTVMMLFFFIISLLSMFVFRCKHAKRADPFKKIQP